jgi:hypothetical protein
MQKYSLASCEVKKKGHVLSITLSNHIQGIPSNPQKTLSSTSNL